LSKRRNSSAGDADGSSFVLGHERLMNSQNLCDLRLAASSVLS
jgi:hypothetical protein